MQNLQNDFAERALIAGLFHNPDLVASVSEIVKPEDFYETKHEIISETVFSLAEKGISVDPVVVFHELSNQGRLPQAGGITYLSELLNPAEVSHMTADPVGVALIIRDIAKKRRLHELGGALMDKAAGTEGLTSNDVLEFAETSIVEMIADSGEEENYFNVESLIPEVVNDVQAAKDLPEGAMLGIPTGFTEFDRMTQGLKGGQMIIVAARPGVGKNLALDTPIPTAEGWKNLADVTTGDSVLGLDGKPYPVILAHEPHVEPTSYEVAFTDSEPLTAGAGHLWTIEADRPFDGSIPITGRLSENLRLLLDRVVTQDREQLVSVADLTAILGNMSALFVAAERMVPRELAVQPRLNLSDKVVEHGRRVALKRLTDFTHLNSGAGKNPVTVSEATAAVYTLDGENSKTSDQSPAIPVPYYRSRDFALSLLRVVEAWNGEDYHVGTVDTSTLVELLDSGAVVKVPAVSPFSGLPQGTQFPTGLTNLSRQVVSATAVEPVEMRCLTVGSPDSMFLAGKSLIPTHNSTLAVDFARNASFLAGRTVLFFSLEMSAKELVARILSAEARVQTQKMKTGDLDETDWMNVREASQKLQGSNFYIDGNPKTTISRVRSVASRQKLRPEGLDMIVIDYLQLMESSSSRKNGSRENEVSELSRSIKLLAKELDVPIIVLSQLNRKAEERAEGKPLVSDLRESGSLEQDADMVLLIHRPSAMDPENRPGQADLIIGKHRGGPMGTIPLAAMMEYSLFADGNGIVPREEEALAGAGGSMFAVTDEEAPW